MPRVVRPLSPRHQQVAELLRRKKSAADISARLGVTLNTAEHYIAVVQQHRSAVAAAATDVRPRLTPREREVIAFLESGATNRDIASRLELGVRTVETHVSNVLRKLGHESRAEIVRELAPNTGLGALSFRQLQVLHLITRGISADEVARRLSIDRRTVTTHVSAIRRKLGVPGNRSLARYGSDHRSD